MSIPGPGPLWRTARHYRPLQLVGYALDRSVRLLERSSPTPVHELLGRIPADLDRDALQRWGGRPEARALAPAWDPDGHGDPRHGRWRFQASEAHWPGMPQWDAPDRTLLWRFHLHYFDTPAALAAEDPDGGWQPFLAELLADHWTHCRPGRSAGWMPYAVAVRLQNLLRVWALLEARGGAEPMLEAELERHTRAAFLYVLGRVELHLLGNHVLKELCVLNAAASVWRIPGLTRPLRALLQRCVANQFLSGGGHEERSPSYHLLALRDLAETDAALGGVEFLQSALRDGLAFAAALEHSDGSLGLFNDGEIEVRPDRADLDRLTGRAAEPWTEGVRGFPEEGYAAARRGGTHLLFDAGPLGPDHMPGHAHCDALSLELSSDGVRVLSNRGTLAYGSGPDRTRSRETAGHCTVQVGEAEQFEIWGAFRVGWRSPARLVRAETTAAGPTVEGVFRWAPSVGAEHRRIAVLEGPKRLQVEDVVTLKGPCRLTARWFVPGGSASEDGRFEVGGQRWSVQTSASLRFRSERWHPHLGREDPALLIEATHEGTAGENRLSVRFERLA